jgi:hypothetical protein
MRRSCTCGILRLVAFLTICSMIAAGIVAPVASAQSSAGFVTLKTFPAAVTAIGMLGGATPTVVVATQNAGIYSMSGTSTVFRKLPAQLDLMRITSVAVLEPDRWLIGTDGDGLWLVKGEGTSFDHVTTLGCTRVARIVQDLRDPDALFIASLCTGLNYSTDRGVTWMSVGEGIASSLVTDVMRMDGDRIAVSSQDAGVFVSANNGTLYARTPCPLMNVSSLAWDATTRTLFAAGGNGVAMTTDAGAHWVNLPSPGTVTSLVALPAGTVLVGTAERGVLRWNSSAKAWWDVAQGAGVTSALTMTCSATTLLVGGTTGALVRVDLSAPVVASVPIVLTVGKLAATVGGRTVMLDSAPYIDKASGRTMVPIRAIVEALGGSVAWKAASRSIMIQLDTTRIVLRIGAMSATVDGVTKPLAVPATILGGRTMVPVRFVAENLGCTVGWNALARTVTITRQG